ncbi:metal ABC transporter solute-binding protein, Zn/Mn family [Deinococcus maricopensis]|uniref:ABC-type metal ion transporter, periplasmic subunit n=1 Tax=Deinococcus maricopensis (strain DSM 21211 / LMG 22137 / NRRL B-23946 / LB-34) TaxID=709986 RepID=E8UAN5_DEIML|nr:zinc ABC transporter substrate-binding protein [Deinococcus maricopensis]ADV68124.1 ABC-type metal ion transporter, periplasmic subunit [Deinococcus maricopensis DSM 21211]
MNRALPLLALLAGAAHATPLPVTATNSIIADFVRSVGGARVNITTLVPVSADAHTFQPGTREVRALASSTLAFQNGANLEPWFARLRSSAAPTLKVITLTDGLKLRAATELDEHDDHDGDHADPHAWWDVTNAAAYTRKVRDALIQADPAGRATYTNNAQKHLKALQAADAYAKATFAKLPAAKRQLVTNHDALGYFAARYGFRVIGQVIPGLGTERDPSARETATLITAIRKAGVRAIFTENTVNARLAQAIARDTGARIAPPLYTDALGPAGSAGDTFLRAFRSNVDTIYRALK